MSMFTKRRKDAVRDNEINALKSELMLNKHHYGCMEAMTKVLAMKYEALKEQNAKLEADRDDWKIEAENYQARYRGSLEQNALLKFAAAQEPLGKEFEKVLFDNLWKLYDTTLPPQVKSEDATCTWRPMDDEYMPSTYEGTCGVAWSFIDGGIEENNLSYCPRCGGKVADVAAISAQEEKGRGL